MATFELAVSTNKVGSKCTMKFEVDDFEAYKEDGTLNEDAINEVAREYLGNLMEWNWYEVES